MAKQLSAEPPLDIYVRSDVDVWAEKLGGQLLSDWMVRLPKSGLVPQMPGFEDGQWWVQDFAASLPVQSLAALVGDLSGKTVLDMCAAPGGKTLQLAAMGAKVTALDKSEERLERVRENLARTKLAAEVICADAFEWARETERTFDIVLLDAPCSATGTFRRHPDVLHNRHPKDVGSLARIQKALLAKAAKLVGPGGYLLYCSCSLQYEEGEAQAIAFTESYADFTARALTVPKMQTGDDILDEKGYIRVLPHLMGENGGLDGFFAALWQKGLASPN
jgi:16S rRNA (cytosine967-C5)-methyltransferase